VAAGAGDDAGLLRPNGVNQNGGSTIDAGRQATLVVNVLTPYPGTPRSGAKGRGVLVDAAP